MKIYILTLSLFLLLSAYCWGQQPESGDMRNISLDSVVVKGYRNVSSLRTTDDGSVRWSMSMLNELPKILGNADPIHYTQLLPGVQTNNEYDGGVHIQGCDNSHNYVSLGDVPIYNVSHLLGFFSVFNGSHFPSMTMQRNATTSASPNRLGGYIMMELPSSILDTINGEFAIGLISSQGTLRLPINKRQQLTLSARASYLNLLYGGLLKNDDSDISYSFYDINATYLIELDKKNKILADIYLGNDNATIGMTDYDAELLAKWGNHTAAIHWVHDNDNLYFKHTLYNSKYHNNFSLNINPITTSLPSSINDWGYRGELHYGIWNIGTSISLYNIKPQDPSILGGYFTKDSLSIIRKTKSQEYSLFADATLPITPRLSSTLGARATLYSVENRNHYSLDPTLSLKYKINDQWWTKFNYSVRHQYLLQTGISSSGLPVEFWTSTGTSSIAPQYQHSISLAASGILFGGRYSIDAEIYHKWLYHLQEYQGTMFDFINTKYDISNMLHEGKGINYGLNLIINKRSGKLTGWLSYSLSRALRHVPHISTSGYYPANHERLHEINGVATYCLGKRWNLGSTIVWATGTPFTAPKHFYISAGNIMAEYADHNSNHLTPYFRLDVSANYKFKSKRFKEHGINISIYNLTYRSNKIFYYMKMYKDEYYYSHVSFLTRILPSVSYYCKF